MSNFAGVLKQEIARLVRKELKGEVAALRKAVNGHRREIAALMREFRSLLAENKRLAKAVTTAKSVSEESGDENIASTDGRRAKHSAESLLAIRQKLGLAQTQIAKLIGVSGLSIYKWEPGKVTPCQAQQEKVCAVRTLRKREVTKLLGTV